MKEFLINDNDSGQRLDRFVAKAVPLLPGSLAQKYIRIKRIKVGGKGIRRDYILRAGDVVQMYVNDEFFEEGNAHIRTSGKSNTARFFTIVYEDEHILLADKKPGILCHSGGLDGGEALISAIQSYLFQNDQWRPAEEKSFAPALCNRIDRNTSGIVIAAKTAEALRIMNEKIRQREIDKHYLAVVHGCPAPDSGRLEGHMTKDTDKNLTLISAAPQPGSKAATMEYKTLAYSGNLTLLECLLITGRAHQIRAQLSDMGYPLLGDIKYGGERINRPYGERIQALCAYKLVFSFRKSAGVLSYLTGKSFVLSNVPFVDKYFENFEMSRIT